MDRASKPGYRGLLAKPLIEPTHPRRELLTSRFLAFSDTRTRHRFGFFEHYDAQETAYEERQRHAVGDSATLPKQTVKRSESIFIFHASTLEKRCQVRLAGTAQGCFALLVPDTYLIPFPKSLLAACV